MGGGAHWALRWYLTHEENCKIWVLEYENPCWTPFTSILHFVPKDLMHSTKDGEHICDLISSFKMEVK